MSNEKILNIPNMTVMEFGVGKTMLAHGRTADGRPCVYLIPVVGEPHPVGERVEGFHDNGVYPEGTVALVFNNEQGSDLLIECIQARMRPAEPRMRWHVVPQPTPEPS